MLRFPNPGSTINNFVAVYTAAINELRGCEVTLDNLLAATVRANLATSSGHSGHEAIARSTRPDRSRDPLYNQLKMYAELFRALGWLHPTDRRALINRFTLLGEQVVAAGPHYSSLLGECVLGIAHPSHTLTIKGDYNLRPFSAILQTMLQCDGALSRDEMIVGPLSVSSDRTRKDIFNVASRINELRRHPDELYAAMADLVHVRGVKRTTFENYTRWPIAVMRDLGWARKDKLPYRDSNKTFQVHRLTDIGEAIAYRVSKSADLRADQVDTLPTQYKSALALTTHYSMLSRSGFDISHVQNSLSEISETYLKALERLEIDPEQPLLFSPFQSMTTTDIADAFNQATPVQSVSTTNSLDTSIKAGSGTGVGRRPRNHLFVAPIFVDRVPSESKAHDKDLSEELQKLRRTEGSVQAATAAFLEAHSKDTQMAFYPLVSSMFRIIGFQCDYSRAGVNYQRWDAWIITKGTAIPIEIKSPTEEQFLSTKAVRQALENKIVLLSRGGLVTKAGVSTLIVGYKIPNERSEMSTLIDDIFSTYEISIGVIDLRVLATLAIKAVCEEITINSNQLIRLRGFLDG